MRRDTYRRRKNNKQKHPKSSQQKEAPSSQNPTASRNKKEHVREIHDILENQAGVTSYLLNNLPDVRNELMDVVVKETLALTALFTSLYDCSTKRSAVATLYLYFEKRCSAQNIYAIADFVKELLDIDILNNQSAEMSDDEPLPFWLKAIKTLRSDWKSAVGNSAFKQVSTLLSMAAALGLCDLASLKFDVNGIRIFSIPAYKKHLTALDFMEATVDTVLYFVEGGYKCFVEGSLRPFIFSNDEARQLDKEYFEIMDLVPFMKTGTMESKKGVTENDFDLRLNKAIDRYENLYHAAEGSFDKGVIHSKLMRLRAARADFIAVRCDGKLREAPYGAYIYGTPGIGKSTVSAVVMRIVLNANGFDSSDERIITLNEADRFEPTYRGYINGVNIDDFGQTLPNFAQKSPVEKIFEFVNNVPAYANMPEADLKGKIPKNPACLVANSNLEANRVAGQFTASAAAAVRRFNVHAQVFVKSDFALPDGRLDSKKAIEHYGGQLPPIPDLWDINVYVPDITIEKTYVKFHAKLSLPEFVDYLIKDSRIHFASQKRVVEFGANLGDKLRFCEICDVPITDCKCDKCELNNQSFEDLRRRVREILSEARIYNSRWLQWTNYVPEYLFDNRYFDAWLAFWKRNILWNETIEAFNAWRGGLLLGFITTIWSIFAGWVVVIFATWAYLRVLIRRKRDLIMELRDMNGAMPELFRNIRDNHVKTIACAGTAMGVLYLIVRAWRASRALDNQGNLSPASYADIKARDEEVSPWAGLHIERPVSTQRAACLHNMTHAINAVSPNVTYFEIEDSVSTRFTNAFAWKGTYLLVPSHIWRDDAAMGTLWRYGKKNINGTKYSSHLHKEYSSVQVDKDLYMIQFDNVQIFPDLTELISPEYHRSTPAVMLYRSPEGDLKEFKIYANKGTVVNKVGAFDGYSYEVAEGTFNGLCMAPLISDTVSRQVIGLHLGGLGKKGGAVRLTTQMLLDAEKKLLAKQAVLQTPSRGEILTEQYGKVFYLGETVDDKSPTRFLPEDNVLNVYGTVIGRGKTHSQVTKTPISTVVEEVCGVPCKWGKPKFHSWKPWQASLEHSSKPSVGVEVELLQAAMKDYKEPLIRLVESSSELRDEIRPLTRLEVVSGRDGVRFIDKMKPNTSIGFPLSGPKSDYLTQLNPDEYPEHNYPLELDNMFWEEVDKMKANYRQGKACHPIFKACLKDEPTPLDKDKVRVFQAAPIALQLMIREYFLPIARLLSMYPLVSECAVGVNATGPEWNQMRDFVTMYGTDRILAGDYSKYDLRMPAQLIKAAFRVLIDIAKSSGNYTEDDLQIMACVANEVAYATMAYNGDLVGHVGSHPSGQNLTAYVNSIVNSLLFRCAWFDICGKRKTCGITFRDVCALITYGDDAKSSVKKGWDEFNHISYAEFLAKHDMKFTMPDKTSTPVAYMKDEDADFLKRKNVWNPRVNMYFGALDENSIFKSLHSVLHSSAISPEEVAAMNIDGALREWFAYGENHYETRRAQMREVATKTGLEHMCSMIDRDYESVLLEFADKYDVVLDNQSGELGDPTHAELEVYATRKCMRETMQGTDREKTKSYKRVLRDIRVFEKNFGERDVLELQAGIDNQQNIQPPYLSEEHQLNELRTRLESKGLSCVGLNIPTFGIATIGEVDALFETMCLETDTRVIVLVEAKMRGNRKKALAQLGKYGLALAILQPEAHIVTMLMTGRVLEQIGSFNGSAFDASQLEG